MVGSARALALALAALALATRAHIPSHDNILRIQLWDDEGLSREPYTTEAPTITTTRRVIKHRNVKVNLDSLYNDMLQEYGVEFGRFTRHKVRHKRRRPRQSGTDLPWRFHSGQALLNVAEYSSDVPWEVIEGQNVVESAVSESGAPVNKSRVVSEPMTLQQVDNEEQVMRANTQQDNVAFQRYLRPRWLIAIH